MACTEVTKGDPATTDVDLPEIHICNRVEPKAACPDGASVVGDQGEFCAFSGGTGHRRWSRYSCRESGEIQHHCSFLQNRPELRVVNGSCMSAVVDEMAFELRWNDEDASCGVDSVPCHGDLTKTGIIQGGVLGDDWGDDIGENIFQGGAGEVIAAARKQGVTAVAVRWQQGWRLNVILSGTGWMTHKSEIDEDDKFKRPAAVQAWVAEHVALGHAIGSYGCSGGNTVAIRGWIQHGLRRKIRHVLFGGGAGWNTAAGCGCVDEDTGNPDAQGTLNLAVLVKMFTREAIDYQFRTGIECQGHLSSGTLIECPECRDGECEYPLSRHGNYPARWDASSLDPELSGKPVDFVIPDGCRVDLIETAADRTPEALFDRLQGNKHRHVLPGGGHCDWTKKGAWGSRTACKIIQQVNDLDPGMCEGFCGYETEPCDTDDHCCNGRTCVLGACTCAPAGDPCASNVDCCKGLVCARKVCSTQM